MINIRPKTADRKLKKIGFRKLEQSDTCAIYERTVILSTEQSYVQRLDFLHKKSGNHIIQSYNRTSYNKSEKPIVVGLTPYEMELCILKIKEMGWKINRK